jgi:uncharacterized repeat protein (TIGR03833 family)
MLSHQYETCRTVHRLMMVEIALFRLMPAADIYNPHLRIIQLRFCRLATFNREISPAVNGQYQANGGELVKMRAPGVRDYQLRSHSSQRLSTQDSIISGPFLMLMPGAGWSSTSQCCPSLFGDCLWLDLSPVASVHPDWTQVNDTAGHMDARQGSLVEFFFHMARVRKGTICNMSGTQRANIKPGSKVSIVLKTDQRTGKLTDGVVKDILTKSADHPHGIKVRLEDGQIGRVKKIS